jgi:hypothetical protein
MFPIERIDYPLPPLINPEEIVYESSTIIRENLMTSTQDKLYKALKIAVEALEFDPTQFPDAEDKAIELSIKWRVDAVQILEMCDELCKVFRAEALNQILPILNEMEK